MWKPNCWIVKTICVLLCACLLLCTGCTGKLPSADGVTFTDALGREVCVPKGVQRVATLIGSFAEVWQLAGGTVCATAADAWDDFGLELGDAVNIGGAHSPSLELLLSAEPDWVIASASTAADVALKESLEAAGIPVTYFDVDTVEDYLAMLAICTDITGRKDLYDRHGERVREQIEQVKADARLAALTESQRTVLLLRVSSGSVKAKGSRGTVLGEMLCDLGCVNIADSDSTLLEQLSVESVMRRQPYRIFVVTMGDDTDAAMKNLSRMMSENAAWGTLEAVQNGRLHVMDRHLFNLKPNARWGEAYETLCGTLCA